MDDNYLLLLIKHVDRRSPLRWLHELRVNELGCFFVDVALFPNGIGGIAVLDQLFVRLFSQIKHNLGWNVFQPLFVVRRCFFQMVRNLKNMPVVFFSAHPEVFKNLHNVRPFNRYVA